MRKYVVGFLVGAALSFTLSANAEEIKSLIGKQVDGQVSVVVDNKELSVPAVIIEGTSYAPLRAVGEAVGRDVDWAEGKVLLNSKEAVTVPDEVTEPVNQTKPEDLIYKNKIKKFILNVGEGKEVDKPPFVYTEVDGNSYISATALTGPYEVLFDGDKQELTFKRGDFEHVFSINYPYQPNVDCFVLDGISLFKLSTLGLKATISGDTLIIDQQ